MQIEERDPGSFVLGRTLMVLIVIVGVVGLVFVFRGPALPTPEAQQIPLLSTDEGSVDYDLFATVLDTYVDERGMVDYAGVKASPAALDAFLAQLEDHSPDSNAAMFTTEDEALTYWLNAYNAWCMKIVADHYPVDSINDIGEKKGAAFDLAVCKLGGKTLSLNNIEQDIVRVQFPEPRVHFALNCASLGCPPLPPWPFQVDMLDMQLDSVTIDFLSRKWYAHVNEDGSVALSSILKWYGEDFIKWLEANSKEPLIGTWVQLYAHDDVAKALEGGAEIEFIEYDWRLTDQAADWGATERR